MISDFNFNVTSWFLGNVHVKPYLNTQCPPPPISAGPARYTEYTVDCCNTTKQTRFSKVTSHHLTHFWPCKTVKVYSMLLVYFELERFLVWIPKLYQFPPYFGLNQNLGTYAVVMITSNGKKIEGNKCMSLCVTLGEFHCSVKHKGRIISE